MQAPREPKTPRRWAFAWLAITTALVWLWASHATGLVSSNDGSHVALARALALRGQTSIDPESALTLSVDVAKRGGVHYSDRPPGTAWLALPAVTVGHWLDSPLLSASREQGRLLVAPASTAYLFTYAKRSPRAKPLAQLMGTSLALRIHGCALALIGLIGLRRMSSRLELRNASVFAACLILGSASLYGTYSTALFSHASTMVCIIWFLVGVVDSRHTPRSPLATRALIGIAGSMAIACDYATLLAIIPTVALCVHPRHWPGILLATLPVAGLVALYHEFAFGSPFSVGYDHHHNFAFTRDRAGTFDGDLWRGLNTLWGFEAGAGVLAQSPVLAIGALVVPVMTLRRDPSLLRRLWCAWLPWMVLMAKHHTVWGGHSADHRYLTPMFPVLALGLTLALDRSLDLPAAARRSVAAALLGLAGWSAIAVWSHFLDRQQGAFVQGWPVGTVLAAVYLAAGSIRLRFKRRDRPSNESDAANSAEYQAHDQQHDDGHPAADQRVG